jgi:hypothetical protein
LPSLLSTAKSGYQQVLTENENAFDAYLTEKMQASMRLVHDVLGVTNAALMAVREEGEIIE